MIGSKLLSCVYEGAENGKNDIPEYTCQIVTNTGCNFAHGVILCEDLANPATVTSAINRAGEIFDTNLLPSRLLRGYIFV